jgi:probable HAF family extracellular repeat protein
VTPRLRSGHRRAVAVVVGATLALVTAGGPAAAAHSTPVRGVTHIPGPTSTCATSADASSAGPVPGLVSDTGRRTPGPRSLAPIFVLDGDRLTVFDPPGPVPAGFPGPVAQDVTEINNRGQVVGGYKEDVADPDTAGFRGYLRDVRGRVDCIDVPGAAGTTPFDLNDHGQIVGTSSDTDSSTGRAQDKRGFVRDARGRYRTIHVPGAVQTQAFGINDRGQVVGEYYLPDGSVHGYLWRNGRFKTIDGPQGAGAAATDINNRGQILGVHAPGGVDELRGFLLTRGRYETFDAPGRYDQPFGLNNRGQIVVSTTDGPLTNIRAFLMRDGVDGPFTEINVPGASATFATGIDDRGRIVGLYGNATPESATQHSEAMPMPMPAHGALPPSVGDQNDHKETR